MSALHVVKVPLPQEADDGSLCCAANAVRGVNLDKIQTVVCQPYKRQQEGGIKVCLMICSLTFTDSSSTLPTGAVHLESVEEQVYPTWLKVT